MIIPVTMKEEETRRAGREGEIQVEVHEGDANNCLCCCSAVRHAWSNSYSFTEAIKLSAHYMILAHILQWQTIFEICNNNRKIKAKVENKLVRYEHSNMFYDFTSETKAM